LAFASSLVSPRNGYLIDQEAQRTISYTGINRVFPQDSAATEGMGDISDHTLENLAASERMIVITWRRLLTPCGRCRTRGRSHRAASRAVCARAI